MASFFFFMTLLDGGTIEDAKMEVKEKFVSTWKVYTFFIMCSINIQRTQNPYFISTNIQEVHKIVNLHLGEPIVCC